jgi:carboxyl-terminal processing protease
MKRFATLFFIVTAALLSSCRDSSKESRSQVKFSEPVIAKTLEKVRQLYVENPDEKKMLEGALNGMLMALDPYSCFFNEESYKIYTQSTKGEFGGLGIEVIPINGVLKVIAPMDDMPAQKAGIKAGDLITHVDNMAISSLAPEEVFKRLHGKPGTTVALKISRGFTQPYTVKITRELITVNPVKYRAEGTVGYIKISYFNDHTTDKLIESISALQKSLGKSLHGIVLDLRNNPGGTLDQAVSVCNLFLNSGTIVQVKGRNKIHNQTVKAKGKDLVKDIPIAVLINPGSASASEIVAAALRDNHRAVLIGEKSFGKGSIQGIYPLEEFGGFKITIALFYTPKGEEIQGRGIEPDITINTSSPELIKEQSKETTSEDKQLQRALDLLNGLWAIKLRP